MWIKAQNKTLVNSTAVANIYVKPVANEYYIRANFVNSDYVTDLGIYQTRAAADRALDDLFDAIGLELTIYKMKAGGDA